MNVRGVLNTLKLVFGGANKATLDASGLTAPRTYTLSDIGGTLALTSVTHSVHTATTYSFALTDAYTVVVGDNSSAITFSVEPASGVDFPLGTVIGIQQGGDGQISITPGSGVTINAPGGALKTLRKYSEAAIRKTDTDTWTAVGELTI